MIPQFARPELGQMAFGQPWQALECPPHIERAVEAIRAVWDAVHREEESPFSNKGGTCRYDGRAFRVWAYSWDDDEDQPWNFRWRDVEVSWYKYCGRGMTINREVSEAESRAMLAECVAEILALARSGNATV